MHKKFKNSSIYYIITNISSYIATFFGFFIAFNVIEVDKSISVSILLLIFILIIERVSFLLKDIEQRRMLDSIQNTISANLHNNIDNQVMEYDKAIEILGEDLVHAHSVKNTFVRNGNKDFHNRKNQQLVQKTYLDFLSKPNVIWEDIVGINDFESLRYDEINRFEKDKLEGDLVIHITKKNPSVLNFIVLYFHDRKKEVFFGWGEDRKIVRSSNDVIVEIFESYYDNLVSNSYNFVELVSDINQPQKHNRFVNKCGSWATLTVDENKKVSSYGYLQMEVRDRRLEIGGIVKWKSPEQIEDMNAVFHHREISYSGDCIFLEYMTQNKRGICVYKFRRDMADNKDKIVGYILDESGKKVDLYGVRLNPETAEMVRVQGIRKALHGDYPYFEEFTDLEDDLRLEGILQQNTDSDEK